MHLKSTPIFLVISLISLTLFSNVYAYTDAEITNMYRGQDDNQTLDNIDAALHSGSLHCSDLPSNLVMGYCQNQTTSNPPPQQTSTTQTSSNSGLVLIPLLMIVPLALILIMEIITGGDGIHMPRIFMKPKAKLKDNKYTEWTDGFGKTHKISMNECRGTLPKGFGNPVEEPKSRPIQSRHKFLLSLGLMKVKKK